MSIPYKQVTVDGKKMDLHRHLWEQANGPIPEGMQIDHINRDPLDNRLENLRCVTVSVNQLNRDNVKGFSWNKAKRAYMARIKLNYKTIYLGMYDNVVDAHAAYLRAKREYLCQTL